MKFSLSVLTLPLRVKYVIIIMKIFVLMFSTAVFSLTSEVVVSQTSKIKIKEDISITVDQVFDLIVNQTDYDFFYEEGIFQGLPNVKLKKGVIDLQKLLTISLSAGGFETVFTTHNGVIIRPKQSKTQQRIVQGKVTDDKGESLLGVTVFIKGTAKGTNTDENGAFRINVPNPENVLVFSYLGFETKEVLVGNQAIINIALKETITALDAVTIKAGYYNTTQRKTTGSISRISSKTIERQVVSNPLEAMQGYMPGVNITQNGGDAGAGFKIQIRSRSFIEGGNEPLYIVDGIPHIREEDIGGNVPGFHSFQSNSLPGRISPLDLIDTNNIESIEVLKDADATAIYGSRGANGVVIITTKTGRTNQTKFEVNLGTTLSSVSRFTDLLNTKEYLNVRRQIMVNSGWSTLEDIPDLFRTNFVDLLEWSQDRYTNWQKVLIGGTAQATRAHASLSGGGDLTKFLIGGSYEDQSTVYLGEHGYRKSSINSNINHSSANNLFNSKTSILFSSDRNNLPGGLENMTTLANKLPPNAPSMYDSNNNFTWVGWTFTHQNPLANLEEKFERKTSFLQLNQKLSYVLSKNFQLSASVGYNKYLFDVSIATPNTYWHPDSFSGQSSDQSEIELAESSTNSFIIEPQIDWSKDWGNININTIIGATLQQTKGKSTRTLAKGFPNNSQISNIAAANSTVIQYYDESDYKYAATYFRFNIAWDDTLFFNATGRRDGSSRFAPGSQFGNFGALGVGFIFTNVPFLEGNKFFSFGKLRSSYGVTGSDNVGNYEYFDTYAQGQTYNGSGLQTTRLYSSDFRWQSNRKFEIGLELGMLDDRIFLSTSWYQNRSSNQLVQNPLPATTGFESIRANLDALVENSGLEIDFRSVNIENNNFSWTSSFNLSLERSKLIDFENLEESVYKHQLVIGKPLNIRKLYHFTGVNPDDGAFEYEDFNQDGIINDFDRQFVMDLTPDFYGGFDNTIRYKNLSLNIFFQFKKHRIRQLANNGIGKFSENIQSEVLNSSFWSEILQHARADNIDFNELNRYNSSNIAYTDGSFIRLRNVNLSYNLPEINGMKVNLFFQAQNLLTLTKFAGPDPDHFSNQHLPALRKITFGLNLKF